MKKVILVDGNNLMFRSYFATAYSGSLMKNSKGFATNALYGFTSMINKIVEEEKPEYMVVAFDIGKNFRHEKYKSYKAGRNETPEDLKLQMPVARTLLDALGIKHLELEGYEADDIIGTLAKEADLDPEYDALIISSDHDLLQLISPQVSMKLLQSKGFTYYNEKTFIDEYKFEPKMIIDLKSLMGDSSDNIPGVKGIGEKTAMNLIQTFGSLNSVYSHLDEIKGKLQEKLRDDKENAYFSYELATIFTDVPLEINLSKLTYDGPNLDMLNKIYTELEFHSFLKNLTLQHSEETVQFTEVKTMEDIPSSLEFSYFIELDKENYHDANVIGMGLYDGNNAYFIPNSLVSEVLKKFKNQLRYTYALKKNLKIAKNLNIELANTLFDLDISYYLTDGTIKDDIAIKMRDNGLYCYYYEDFIKGKVSENDLKKGLVNKAKFIWDNVSSQMEKLESLGMLKLFNEIEMPLIEVLSSMEEEGIRVDKDILIDMQGKLKEKITELETIICDMANVKFNVASPKQLGDVLFNQMNIPYPGKKSGNYSTDSSILEKLVSEYPIVELILEYRTLAKLYNTYVEPLEDFIRNDGKIHTIYKQTLTRTGRLSSVEPNLQNIPTREEEGRLIKKAFLAEPNSSLMSADYSQIELRILAHIASDETMINAFINNDDIHKKVAADIHGVPYDEVTKDMRRTAKSVIFGIVYGISGFGLGENLNMNPKKAKEFIDKYYQMYPKVHEYMENIKKEAYQNGYVKTLFNRIRYIDELKSPVYTIRTSGERIALNTPIQGTGADLIKLAMVNLYRELKRKELKSKILLQVHDEIILNVYDDEKEIVEEIVVRNMENVANLKVPLKVEVSFGKNWYETK